MPFKSPQQPFCRMCGKPIPKFTVTVYVRGAASRFDVVSSFARYTYVGNDLPKTIADCRRLTNGRVVSVRRRGEQISQFSEWDGESYVDEYFHNSGCAIEMAYAAVRKHDLAAHAWTEAMTKHERLQARGPKE